jgi:hypothetical protein
MKHCNIYIGIFGLGAMHNVSVAVTAAGNAVIFTCTTPSWVLEYSLG